MSERLSGRLSETAVFGVVAKTQELICGKASGAASLSGSISRSSVSGAVERGQEIAGGKISGAKSVAGRIATAFSANAAAYTGDYEVTPTVAGEVLKTRQRYMTDDVTIHGIPFFEVGNTTGGTTVYIAGDIEFE